MKALWLLRLIRTIVNQICGHAYELAHDPNRPTLTPTEVRHLGIASRIRDILIDENINEN